MVSVFYNGSFIYLYKILQCNNYWFDLFEQWLNKIGRNHEQSFNTRSIFGHIQCSNVQTVLHDHVPLFPSVAVHPMGKMSLSFNKQKFQNFPFSTAEQKLNPPSQFPEATNRNGFRNFNQKYGVKIASNKLFRSIRGSQHFGHWAILTVNVEFTQTFTEN